MEETGLLRAVLSLGFVVGLILLTGWAARKWDIRAISQKMQQGKRLKLIEQLYLDPKRKLAIIQCDSQQYLLVSGTSEQLIPLNPPQVAHE